MIKYILFMAIWVMASCIPNGEKDSVKPRATDITELVYASVTVKPGHSYFPQPTRSGIIKKIYVDEGQKVEKGQLLALISATADVTNRVTNAQINLKEARENYLGPNNRVQNIELELQSLREQLSSDSLKYHRQRRLWEQNIGKKVELEQSELAYKVTKNKYESLQQRKEQTLNELENQYKRALSQVKAEQTQLEDFELRSALGGVVYTVNKKEGELISSQDRLAEIGTTSDFIVEMDIDEEDVTKIKTGDTVAITLNAYEDEVFTARVSKVFPKKDETTQTFRVESIFIKQPPRLYNGLSGEANIIVSRRKNVIVIPSEYLMEGNKVLTDEGERSVKTGLKNMKFVEIVSGIDTSATILKPEE